MSRGGPMHVPDAPESIDRQPRWRWVPPLCLGVALGGLIGCVATFAVLGLSKRSLSKELAAERFNAEKVLDGVPWAGDGHVAEDKTEHLGHTSYDTDRKSASAVRRRIQIRGTLAKGTDPGAFAQQVAARVDAELNRLGTDQGVGGTSSSSGGNEARLTSEMGYYNRDGRRGHYDLSLVVRDGQVEGILIITEGR